MPITTLSTLQEIAAFQGLDFLIIGGGTSGIVLASRLSANPDIRVGLLEAGEHHVGSIPELEIPGLMGRALSQSKYNWGFTTTPQPDAYNRCVALPRGKGLGGSTLINYMANTRPGRAEYDALQSLGNRTSGGVDDQWNGWDWKGMVRSMKKSENMMQPEVDAAAGNDYSMFGMDGPITHTRPSSLEQDELAEQFINSVQSLDIPINPNPYNGNNIGVWSPYNTIDPNTKKRVTSVSGYLDYSTLSRENLFIVTGVCVTKIIFSSASDMGTKLYASGVEVMHEGIKKKVLGVKGDVLLSAGTFQTPRLLEQSGIGNPEILSKAGIPCILDLPGVGENLHDHVAVPIIVEVNDGCITGDILNETGSFQEQLHLYTTEKKGLLANTLSHVMLMPPTLKLFENEDELKSWVVGARSANTGYIKENNMLPAAVKKGLEIQFGLQERFFLDPNLAQVEIIQYQGHQPLPPHLGIPGKRYVTLPCVLMHPLSRGSVHTRPTLPSPSLLNQDTTTKKSLDDQSSQPPPPNIDIDPQLLGRKEDLDLLVRAMQLALRICTVGEFGSSVKRVVVPPIDIGSIPGGIEGEGTSDEGITRKLELGRTLEEHARRWSRTVFHPVGTAAMMPRELGGVVDAELRVYGVENLRVTDLSVLPMAVSCHTVSTAYAIGERAVEIILGPESRSQAVSPIS